MKIIFFLIFQAHGKRSDNKNYIVRKLLPTSLRELPEPKALRYSEISQPLFASKVNDIRRKNAIKCVPTSIFFVLPVRTYSSFLIITENIKEKRS